MAVGNRGERAMSGTARRFFAVSVVLALIAGWAATIAGAATGVASGTPTDVNLFGWASKPGGFSENWPEGIGLFGLGFFGALVTVYLFLGESLPSMGGKAEYGFMQAELTDLKKRRDRSFAVRERYASGDPTVSKVQWEAEGAVYEELASAISNLEDRASKERRRLFALGFPIYLVLGGFFAAAVAANPLQALVVGFGWTSIADRFGLRRELEVRGAAVKDQVTKLENQGAKAQSDLDRCRAENALLQAQVESLRQAIQRLALGEDDST